MALLLVFLAAVLVALLQPSNFAAVHAAQPNSIPGLQVTPAPASGLNTPQKIETARVAGQIDKDQAALYLAYALRDFQKLPPEYRSDVPWDGTLPLLQLRQSIQTNSLRSQAATAVEALLSGTCDIQSASLPFAASSSHYYLEYGAVGGGLSVNDYVASLETAWATEVTSFGWAAPPVKASNPPPGNKYHVRIEPLGPSLYGFVSSQGTYAGLVGDNPNTGWNDVDAYASCMVLNSNYSGFPGTPQTALDATTAHEFNHSIQYGIGALSGSNQPDADFVEGGATWMEDEVFDNANDNYNYLWPQFDVCMGEYKQSPYPYWITFRGMVERYGTGVPGGSEAVMQAFWELTSQNTAGNLDAMNQAFVIKEGTSLAAAYHNYAIAVRFNKPCGAGVGYPYCLEEGPNYPSLPTLAGGSANHGNITSISGSYAGSLQDNYALNWIGLPGSGSPYNVTLRNQSSGGQLRGSVVCDKGTSLAVNPLPAVAGSNTATTLYNYNPNGCNSVVLVVTNQAQTAANPAVCIPRNYQVTTAPGTIPTPTGPLQYIYMPFVQVNP